MKTLFILPVILVFQILACETAKAPDHHAAKNVSNVSTAAQASNANAAATPSPMPEDRAKPKYCKATGVITLVRPDTGEIELNHEECTGDFTMPKMTMMFFVDDRAKLKDLKKDDKVEFTLQDKAGAELITEIKKVK